MAHEQITTSGLQTADGGGAITQPCYLHAVTIVPAAAASSIVLYDNATAASGTVLAKVQGVANGETVTQMFDNPVFCSNGIYGDVTGASAAFIFYYSL